MATGMTMDSWIDFASGRLFVCALAFMILGLIRLATLTGWTTSVTST